MEKSISYLREQFQLENRDIKTYSPLTLAYIGDGIYELLIRTILVSQGNCPPQKLHKRASALVKAEKQSQMIDAIEPHLTETEHAVYKRGRNAKSYTMAKNASMSDYRRATGFEALMGYLYLSDQNERMIDLIKIGLDYVPEDKIVLRLVGGSVPEKAESNENGGVGSVPEKTESDEKTGGES